MAQEVGATWSASLQVACLEGPNLRWEQRVVRNVSEQDTFEEVLGRIWNRAAAPASSSNAGSPSAAQPCRPGYPLTKATVLDVNGKHVSLDDEVRFAACYA